MPHHGGSSLVQNRESCSSDQGRNVLLGWDSGWKWELLTHVLFTGSKIRFSSIEPLRKWVSRIKTNVSKDFSSVGKMRARHHSSIFSGEVCCHKIQTYKVINIEKQPTKTNQQDDLGPIHPIFPQGNHRQKCGDNKKRRIQRATSFTKSCFHSGRAQNAGGGESTHGEVGLSNPGCKSMMQCSP